MLPNRDQLIRVLVWILFIILLALFIIFQVPLAGKSIVQPIGGLK